MKAETKTILLLIEQYLESHPIVRFGQALFNLGIIEFADKNNPEKANYTLRDIHGDEDSKILKRILNSDNGCKIESVLESTTPNKDFHNDFIC